MANAPILNPGGLSPETLMAQFSEELKRFESESASVGIILLGYAYSIKEAVWSNQLDAFCLKLSPTWGNTEVTLEIPLPLQCVRQAFVYLKKLEPQKGICVYVL